MKDVGAEIYNVNKAIANGEDLGGTCYTGTIENGAVGYAPSTDKNVPAEIVADTDAVKELLAKGEVVAPANEADFNAFVAALG